jgi:hypothetical protein
MQHELREAGYTTAIAGKYLNGWKADPPRFDRWATFRSPGYFDATFNVDGVDEVADYSTDFIRDKAIEFLRDFESDDDRPWFM